MKLILFFTLFLAINPVAFSNDEVSEPLLFIAEKSGSEPIFLFGTIHNFVRFDSLPDSVLKAILGSDIVILESDHQNLAELDGLLLEGKMYPNTSFLEKNFGLERTKELLAASQDSLDKINKARKQRGLSPITVNHIPPYILSAILNHKAFLRIGIGIDKSMDKALADVAKQEGKKLVALDHISERLEIDKFFGDDVWKMLGQAAALLIAPEQDVKRHVLPSLAVLKNEYLRGDALALDAAAQAKKMDFVRVRHLRNSWLERVVTATEEGKRKAFVGVGYNHLFGGEGLLNQLEQAGFSLRQVVDRSKGRVKGVHKSHSVKSCSGFLG